MSDVRALTVRIGLALAGLGRSRAAAAATGDGGGPDAGRDDRRRRLEHGLPDQQGGSGGVQQVEPGRSPSSSTTTAPAAASAATSRARSTSSTPRAPAKPDEESKAKAQGIEWTRFLVGYDGITLVVNPKNDFVKSLTVEQLKAIWAPRARSRPGRTSTRPGPTARSSSTRPTTTRGRSSSSPRRSSARPRASATTCSRAPTTTSLVNGVAGDADGAGLLRLRLLRGQQGQAPGRGRAERARTRRPVLPARRRSSTRPTPRCRGRCTST